MPKPSFLDAQQPWHSWEIEQVLEQLQSGVEGLSYVTARQRLRQYGSNKLPRHHKYRSIARQVFTNPFTYVVITLAIAVQYFSGYGWAILLVGVIHAAMGGSLIVWSERTNRLASLGRQERRHFLPASAIVVQRDGETMEVPARDLVMGDLVQLQPGVRPTVDLRLLASEDLQVNEANLSGGAIVAKQADTVLPAETIALERTNMVLAGSEITAGSGWGIVIATGKNTFWQSTTATSQTFSALHRQLRKLRRWWVIITLAVACGMGITAWQLEFNDPVALAAVILVGCYPQNLLRIATLAQLLAIKVLAKKRLWVKYPAAIDALGRIAIIMLILESDTTLNIEDLSPAGISWCGLIRASADDANSLGQVFGLEVYSYFDQPIERIRNWQASQQPVAVMGKELEDIPLLVQADLGLSDRSHPREVRDSAGLVLPKEDFTYLPLAIAAGRAVFDRLQRLLVLIFTGLAATLLLVIAALVGKAAFDTALDATLVPLEILWIGAIVTPALALPFMIEPGLNNIMAQPAAKFQSISRPGNLIRFGAASLTTTIAVIAVFALKYQGLAASLAQARTMGFTTLVFAQGFFAFGLCRRSLLKNIVLVVIMAILVVVQIAFVEVNFLGELMGTVPLTYTEWAIAALAATSVFWVYELLRTN
ncbi:E1-E2 ATPase-associated domain protein [Thalassoporum mexicanum PCC 7367]|uniref:P-type ATPase n=1 Tax=Thalassoporum mexicanum TaxID=3457544 RepID=UPI00029FA770|nr:cation transporting ATPase C-terminal domain-containing protein [Pseudanabaena sp. PCC 7367]AFY70802.1 E1-E2 ATPase-associated domain protein [Pseudanabaena sp. PCC 7367]